MEGVMGAAKYKKHDLPIPAVFESVKKQRIAMLESEKPIEIGGQLMPDKTTGCKVYFLAGQVTIYNSEVLQMMMENSMYGNAVGGYAPHKDDPSGFWEKVGVIEVIQVPQKVVVDSGDFDAADVMKAVKKLKKASAPAAGSKPEPEGQLESGAGASKE